jgi:uncharacterized phiE125 gp8 family phage protein
MALKLYTAPTDEPVTLNEAKLHLRIDTSPISAHPDDTMVTALIKAARHSCENFQNRSYITQTWTLYLDSFPDGDYIEIPKPPLQGVVELAYKDTAGTLQTVSFLDPSGSPQLAITDYMVDVAHEPGRLYLKYGKSWPSTYDEAQAVQVQFLCGYGDAADVPEEVKQAMLLTVAQLYENRGDIAVDANIDRAIEALLWPDRVVPV